MATAEQRAHAGRLLEIHQRNLNDLLERKAKYGDDAPLHLDRQIETEEAAIESLKPFLRPDPPRDVQAFINNVSDGDWAMLFQQGVQQNMRLTKLEEGQVQSRQQQHEAQLWRIEHQDAIRSIPAIATEVRRETKGRVFGQLRNLLLVAALSVFVIANGRYTGESLLRAGAEVLGMFVVITVVSRAVLWVRRFL